MLPAERRVTRGPDFTRAVRGGRRAGRATLVAHLWSPAGTARSAGQQPSQPAVVEARTGPARAGFIVGKAVGDAVTRNRVKRRLRHLVSGRLDELPPAALLVVRALPPAAAPGADLAGDLDAALARLLEVRR